MTHNLRFGSLTLLILSMLLPVNSSSADIVNIAEYGDWVSNMGQFVLITGNDPVSSPGQVEEILDMGNQNTPDTQTGSLQAGVLWSLFDSQGISSLNRIALSLGINESGTIGTNWVTVQSLRITIQDPSNLTIDITDVDLDTPNDNTIHVWNYAQGGNTAEAQLVFDLGYDFMTTFNATSTALIELDATIADRTSGSEIFFFDPAANAIPEPVAAPLLMLFGMSAIYRRKNRSA